MVRRFGLLFTIVATTLFACAGMVLAQSTGTDPQGEELVGSTSSLSAGDVIPDRYVVVFNDEEVSRPGRVANELAQELNFEVKHVYRNALKGFSARVPSGFDLSSALSTDSRVKLVAQDRVVEATAQTLPTGIDRVEADNSSTNAGNGGGAVDEDIAILDTGIAKHPDLNIAGGRNCVGRDSSDYSDGNGHGTHVAGTAAAKDNDRGVVGVALGARPWAVRVLNDNGSGRFASVICGIDWVTGKDTIEVANMSLSATVPGTDDGECGWVGDDASAAMHQAICNSVAAGVFYAVAAGNDSKEFATDVPAAFDEVLTVTAMSDFNGEPGAWQTPPVDLTTLTIPPPPSATIPTQPEAMMTTPSPRPACASGPPGKVAATTRSPARAWPHHTSPGRQRSVSPLASPLAVAPPTTRRAP